MIRNILAGAAIAVAISCGAARAETVLVTTLEPGAGEFAVAIAKIEAVQPRDDTSSYIWIGGHRYIVDAPFIELLNLMSSEAPAGRAIVRQR